MKGGGVVWPSGRSRLTTFREIPVRSKIGARKQDVRVRAEFDAALTTLEGTDDWLDTRYQFRPLEREHIGLGEIRFSLDPHTPLVRRFRPVGIWPPLIPQEFILLMGCEKKSNGILIPADAFTLALAYRRQWDEGKGEIYDYV